MRQLIDFACAGETLVGTLDPAPGTLGLLIVSGGNEIRCGAHRGMAQLATQIAERGYPVFRFDRRGIGDSSGDNGGYATSASDIDVAVAAFRRSAPQLDRIAGFGNCDAATALALHGGGAFDRLILANPWITEVTDELPPAAAIRARYAERIRDPASWARLLTGKVDFAKLVGGLSKAARSPSQLSPLETEVMAAIVAAPPTTILLASGDATAIAFADAARRAGLDRAISTLDTASHSFALPADKLALRDAILAALA